MKGLFVDTAGWMACADAADPAHESACKARDAALEAGTLLITTDYVTDETLTLIRMRVGLPAAKAWWEQVQGSNLTGCRTGLNVQLPVFPYPRSKR
jgi:predicted nucleic acid-binding protein